MEYSIPVGQIFDQIPFAKYLPKIIARFTWEFTQSQHIQEPNIQFMRHSHAVTTYTAALSYLIFHLKASVVVETVTVIHVVCHLNVRQTEIVVRRERNAVSRGGLDQVPVAHKEICRHQQLLNICDIESFINIFSVNFLISSVNFLISD